jgi:hypothetical protein
MRNKNVGSWLLSVLLLTGCSGTGDFSVQESVDDVQQATTVIGPLPPTVPRYFDGVNDRVVVPHRPAYEFGTGDFTLAVTARITNPSTTTVVPLMSMRNSTSPYDGFYFIAYGNQLLLQIRGVNSLSSTVSSLRDGKPHHLAVRRQGTLLTFFVDGTAVGTAANGQNASGPQPLTFGYDSLDGRGLRGSMVTAALWASALADADVASAAAGLGGVSGGTLRGFWDFTRIARDLAFDQTELNNTGSLGQVPLDWDAADPTVMTELPLVGGTSSTFNARVTGDSADQCSDVLGPNGPFDVMLYSSAVSFESAMTQYMCSKYEEVMSKRGSIGLSVPIKGVPVNLTASAEHTKTFNDEYCAASSQAMTYEGAHTIATQLASPILVDAWLECMKLKQISTYVSGSYQSFADGAVNLTAKDDLRLPNVSVNVYNFVISGATCTTAFPGTISLSSTVACKRVGNGAVHAVLNTNLGVVTWNVPALTTATARVTGNTKEWTPDSPRCEAYTSSKYNCPAVRFPRNDCESSNGRTYSYTWFTASDQRAKNATLTVTSDPKFTRTTAIGPTGDATGTTVWGSLLIYKNSVVNWQICADIEKLTAKPFTSASKDIDAAYPFVVAIPKDAENPVLHINYTNGAQKLVDLTNPGTTAVVVPVADGVTKYYEVWMN